MEEEVWRISWDILITLAMFEATGGMEGKGWVGVAFFFTNSNFKLARFLTISQVFCEFFRSLTKFD